MSEGLATKEHVTAEISALRAGMQTDRPKIALGVVVTSVTFTIAPMKLIP